MPASDKHIAVYLVSLLQSGSSFHVVESVLYGAVVEYGQEILWVFRELSLAGSFPDVVAVPVSDLHVAFFPVSLLQSGLSSGARCVRCGACSRDISYSDPTGVPCHRVLDASRRLAKPRRAPQGPSTSDILRCHFRDGRPIGPPGVQLYLTVFTESLRWTNTIGRPRPGLRYNGHIHVPGRGRRILIVTVYPPSEYSLSSR